MPDQTNSQPASEPVGNIPKASESFRTVPKASETFGKVRNDSESFRSVPHPSERKENHSLTVREAARMFEAAGVARTERSITNWCQMNAQGIARLDAYYDPNERKYYITPQSVELAIAEEKAKAAKANTPTEPVGNIPNASERVENPQAREHRDDADTKSLQYKIRDLQITNQAKDMFIERLEKERTMIFEQLLDASHKVGELETRLLQLESPAPRHLKVSRMNETSEEADFKSPPQDQPA
jgi:hypothetical protein